LTSTAGTATFTVTLNGDAPAAGEEITVDYVTAGGTATEGTDYTAKSGTLTFGEGVTEQSITVAITDDTDVEDAETFTVTLSNVGGTVGGEAVTISDAEATGTITDDTVSVDIGAINSPETLDASGNSYIFTDDADVANSVVINGFSTDDVIKVSNASEGDYFFTNNGEDVYITYNNIENGSVVNSIQLVGVVTTNDLVDGTEASFEAYIGFDAFSF